MIAASGMALGDGSCEAKMAWAEAVQSLAPRSAVLGTWRESECSPGIRNRPETGSAEEKR
jgi:hypothetical protein